MQTIKKTGFAQMILILIFAGLFVAAVALYFTKNSSQKPESEGRILTTEEKIQTADTDLQFTASLEEEQDLSEFDEIEREFNASNFSSI